MIIYKSLETLQSSDSSCSLMLGINHTHECVSWAGGWYKIVDARDILFHWKVCGPLMWLVGVWDIFVYNCCMWCETDIGDSDTGDAPISQYQQFIFYCLPIVFCNYMEQTPSWEAEVCYRIHKILPLVLIMSQMKPFISWQFVLILFCLRVCIIGLLFESLTKQCMCMFICSYHTHYPSHVFTHVISEWIWWLYDKTWLWPLFWGVPSMFSYIRRVQCNN